MKIPTRYNKSARIENLTAQITNLQADKREQSWRINELDRENKALKQKLENARYLSQSIARNANELEIGLR